MNEIDGTLITVARLRRSMPKKELAASLGVTPKWVSRYEKDGAPAKRADDLASALKFPSGFFLRPAIDPFTLDELSFRADSPVPAKTRNVAKALGALGKLVYERITEKFTLPVVDVPDLSGESPVDAAWMLRRHWGIADGPLPNTVQLAESRGIHVCGLPNSLRGIDGFSRYVDGLPYIFISRNRTPERFRFSMAHEIGHLVLHRGRTAGREVEKEANQFASEFLIPRAELRVKSKRPVSPHQVLHLRAHFGVSAMAMAHALKQADRLSEYAYRHVCATLSKQGYRSAEPGGMIGFEKSRVFALVREKDSYNFSSVNLARYLNIPLDDIRTLTMDHSLVLVEGEGEVPTSDRLRDRPQLRLV